jgi:signal transduction histidine kinase
MSEAVRVLLVDSDADAARLAFGALPAPGFRVTMARTGGEALAALARRDQDVVVLELRLADMAGGELLGRLAADHPATPALVLTALDDARSAVDAMRAGARDYLVKRPDGSHLRELPGMVTRMLSGRASTGDGPVLATLSTALADTTDGVLVLDAAARIRFVSRALVEAWEMPPGDIVGRPLADFVAPAEGEPPLDALLRAVGRAIPWGGLLRARNGEPPQRVWDVRLSRLGTDRAAGVVLGVFRDISDRHALEQLRADFLSMITHDIKVPLTVILGYTEMLTDPEPPHDQIPQDILTRIRESGEKIHALVCNFLDLSRIEAGRLSVDPRPCDLYALLSHVLEQHGASARRKGVDLALKAEAVPAFMADEPQLERVVTNLVANAIKYTPSGGRLVVTTGRENGRVTVSFRDTGRGIPADELPHLFEKYRRVREAKKTEGTGLGLFIAKTIIDAHGGDIRVESEPGAGSTFTLLLPHSP